MRAYSIDLRQRVVTAVEAGEGTIAQVAARFQVGQTFVKKMLRQWRERDDLTPRPHGGGATASLGTQHLQKLAQQVKKEPDATLEELCQFLGETAQVRVSEATVCRALQRLHLPRKKRA
jgi:transposase